MDHDETTEEIYKNIIRQIYEEAYKDLTGERCEENDNELHRQVDERERKGAQWDFKG